jgi:PKD repeat protein
MKRAILMTAACLLVLAAASCDDESAPTITRIYASPTCGVAPMYVDFYGIASGGNESGDPTGGNNNLEFTWDFGDGSSPTATSIAYHEFRTPGIYTVTLTAKDPDGQTATRSTMVEVIGDSLHVEAAALVDGPVAVGDTVTFDYQGSSCGIDPASETDRASYFTQTWIMNDPGYADGGLYIGAMPQHTFSAPGQYDVELIVTYAGWAVTRRDTVTVTVQ